MEENEEPRDPGRCHNEAKPETNTDNLVDGAAAEPVTPCLVSCAGVQGRPRQNDQTVIVKEIGLVLRQLGDHLEKLADINAGTSQSQKGG